MPTYTIDVRFGVTARDREAAADILRDALARNFAEVEPVTVGTVR